MKSIRRFFEGLGVWVALMPFLHFPVAVRNGLYIVTGITIYVAAYLYLRKRIVVAKDKVEPTFIESVPEKKHTTPHSAYSAHGSNSTTSSRSHRVANDIATEENIQTVSHNSAPQVLGSETNE